MKFTSAFFASVAVLMTMPSSGAAKFSVIVPSTTSCDGTEITTENIVSYCQASGDAEMTANCEGEECENGSGKSGDEAEEDEDDSSSSSCVAGDTIKVTGDITIGDDRGMESFPDVYVTPCISWNSYTLHCYTQNKTKVTGICQIYNYADRGAGCGDAGTYQMDFSVTVPDVATVFNLPITLKTTLSDCDEADTEYGNQVITYSAVGVVLLGVAAGLFQNRRRCVACLSEESGDDTKSEAFIEMNDIEDPGAV
eukprot:CAMPEP_0178503906 /NCGR_PEP_ID=MMETSP0696-20121128/18299_1 /TAXON_ID=265572 /ORGANISM="Extubocellulus spinifer, Strain CCMP396" /LENGTH=252 /DNA_ID=CAMNT_0020133085 /DNA_START=65 /DNA_END=823 /DNA_ORIENTATION=-